MLYANGLIKTFEKNEKNHKKVAFNAVNDISVEINDGEIVGILGPNGAGKTTLLRMLSCLMKPTSGAVVYKSGDTVVDDISDIKRKIGYLSGNTKLYGRLSTRELLTIIGNVYGMEKNLIEERIDQIVEVLDMHKFVDNRIEKLSTGQTQRASIARCIVHDPEVYIFDEPTLGLDIISSSAIIEFMKSEREKGKSVIYSTHYMEEAEYLCDRILLINGGKVISQGTLAELKNMTAGDNLRDIFNALIKEDMPNE